MRTAAAAAKSRPPVPASQLRVGTSFSPHLDARNATIQAKRRRGRGNPTWGSAGPPGGLPVKLSQFEELAAQHNIPPEHWAASHILRAFARKNASRLYVPEDLLLFWGIRIVDGELGDALATDERKLRRNAQYRASKKRVKDRLGHLTTRPQQAAL